MSSNSVLLKIYNHKCCNGTVWFLHEQFGFSLQYWHEYGFLLVWVLSFFIKFCPLIKIHLEGATMSTNYLNVVFFVRKYCWTILTIIFIFKNKFVHKDITPFSCKFGKEDFVEQYLQLKQWTAYFLTINYLYLLKIISRQLGRSYWPALRTDMGL